MFLPLADFLSTLGRGGGGVALTTSQNVYSLLQNIYMDKRVLGTLGIKLQIYCIGRQEN
jgi:hypothetical protein